MIFSGGRISANPSCLSQPHAPFSGSTTVGFERLFDCVFTALARLLSCSIVDIDERGEPIPNSMGIPHSQPPSSRQEPARPWSLYAAVHISSVHSVFVVGGTGV